MRRFPPRQRTLASVARGFVHWVHTLRDGAGLAQFRLHNLDLDVTVRRDSLFARQLARYQGYEQRNSNWVLDRFAGTNEGLFVDVGANFGWYSLLFARCAQGRAPGAKAVVAIEPDPANYALLERNLAHNRIDTVAALCVGVGARRMQATLSEVDAGNPGAHTLRPVKAAVSARTIAIQPLDDLLAPYPGAIRLLKMDIEGYELDALTGAAKTLERTEQLLVEYSPRFLRACGQEPQALLALLRRAGFAPHTIGAAGLVAADEGQIAQQVGEHTPRSQIDLVFQRR